MRSLSMNAVVRKLHRYFALALGLIWLVQAVSGVVIVFGRDVGQAMATRAPQPFDAAALAAGVERIAAGQPQRRVTFVMAADPDNRWFDVLYEDADEPTRFARVDGRGALLYDRPFFSDFPAPGVFMTALHLHQTFLNEDVGLTLVGISGVFLLLSMLFGLKLAWPRAGWWQRVLRPDPAARGAAIYYAWHRALGLWLFLPAAASVIAGILLALGSPLRTAMQADIAEPEPVAKQASAPAGLATAVRTALAQFPGAGLSIVSFPDEESPWYRIRVKQAGEFRSIFGTTVVWVDARDGAVLQVHDALAASPGVDFFDALYPFHSGEIVGLGGRLLTLALGLWLGAMIVLGGALWWRRKRR